ncbi:MAG: hypothetical protein U1F50_11920 [Rubrivivax sp.]
MHARSRNNWGVAHGGVTMTLLDVAMARRAHAATPGGEPRPAWPRSR